MLKPTWRSSWRESSPSGVPASGHRVAGLASIIPRGTPTRRDDAMTTQLLLDFTDVAIVTAFVSATLAFIVYIWRSGRPSSRRHNRLS